MKTTMAVAVKMPANVTSARTVTAKAKPIDPSLIQTMFEAMQGFHASSRRELVAAAKKAGHAEDAVDAALNYLVQAAAFLAHPSGLTKAKRFTASPTAACDPDATGRRLVKELQSTEGGAWTGQELRAQFSLTAAVLHRRRKERRIIYWRDAQHNFHYPKWQFNDAGALLPGIQEVLQQFKSQDEWRVMSYFLGQRAQLSGQRPLDVLRQGNVEKVLEHAQIHAEENTW